MSDAQKMWDAAIGIARAFHDDPVIKAYYREEARRNRTKQEAEEAAAKALRDAKEAKKLAERAYDIYVTSGSGDPCFQAGHSGNCGTELCSLYDGETDSCPYTESFGNFEIANPIEPSATTPNSNPADTLVTAASDAVPQPSARGGDLSQEAAHG